MQALYLQALDPIAETLADPNSYGFRGLCSSRADMQCTTYLFICRVQKYVEYAASRRQ
jgi:RNA-directed DNA polymerase